MNRGHKCISEFELKVIQNDQDGIGEQLVCVTGMSETNKCVNEARRATQPWHDDLEDPSSELRLP